MNKCITTGAKKFEDSLHEAGISYNKFVELSHMWEELLLEEQAEVDNLLRKYEEN